MSGSFDWEEVRHILEEWEVNGVQSHKPHAKKAQDILKKNCAGFYEGEVTPRAIALMLIKIVDA